MRKARPVTFVTALLLIATAVATAAPPAGGEHYAGKTSEGLGVSVRVSGDGSYVTHMRIRYRVTCTDGASGAPNTDLYDLRIKQGRFAFKGTYTVAGSKDRVQMSGHISRKRAHGTFVLNATREKVHCHSKRITWTAHPVS